MPDVCAQEHLSGKIQTSMGFSKLLRISAIHLLRASVFFFFFFPLEEKRGKNYYEYKDQKISKRQTKKNTYCLQELVLAQVLVFVLEKKINVKYAAILLLHFFLFSRVNIAKNLIVPIFSPLSFTLQFCHHAMGEGNKEKQK